MRAQQSNFLNRPEPWLAALFVFVAFVYIYRLGDKSLDFDERYSMNIATGIGGATTQYTHFGRFIVNPLPGRTFSSSQYKTRNTTANVVSTAMNDNGQGLPYFLLLHGWLKVFGVSVFAARFLSVLIMLVSLLLFYQLLLHWRFSYKNAMLILALFACNGVVIGLAQYVRFYSLGILLTVASSLLLTRLSGKTASNWRFVLMGVLWGLMALNQFFAVFVIAAQAVCLSIIRRRSNPILSLITTASGALLPVLIWLIPLGGWESLRNIYTLHQGEHLAIPELTMPAGFLNTTVALIASFVSAVGQPVNLLSPIKSVLLQLLPGLPALLLIVLIASRRDRAILPWMRLTLLVLLTYTIASIFHTTATSYTMLFQGRYWVFAYVFSYSLLGWALAKGLRMAGPLKGLAVLVLCLSLGRALYTSASVISGLSLDSHARIVPQHVQDYEDYEGIAKTLIETADAHDTVSYSSWQVAQRVNWFLLQHPEIIQRVDAVQKDAVLIRHWPAEKQVTIGKGRSRLAQPIWN